MRKLLSGLLAVSLAACLLAPAAGAAETSFRDVPANSALAAEVEKAVDYGLMNGYSPDTFGYGDTMTRAQFVTVVGRMLPEDLRGASVAISHVGPAMAVPNTKEMAPFFPSIEQAARMGWVDSTVPFRPSDPITRGEMAEILVRALGLKEAALQLDASSPAMPHSDTYAVLHGGTPFTDLPWGNQGYITIAYAIGMTNGTSNTTFSPDNTATRAQVAAMLVRVYERMNQPTDCVHGFYAISSYSQLDLAGDMDMVSAGWSRMTWDGETALLSTTSANGNEYAIPSGYEEVTDSLSSRDVPLHLSVFMDGKDLKSLLASDAGRAQAVEQIVGELTVDYRAIGRNPYSGVTIDFEGLRSAQRADFTAFLTELDQELEALDKALYVCVSPILAEGYDQSYSGYDYAAIGDLADKLILMAYDYDTRDMRDFVGSTYYRTAATAPIDQVYLGLKILTDRVDADKVLLGFSSKCTAWQIDGEGNLVSGTPVYPSVETVVKRLAQANTEAGWSNTYQQPYAIYTTEDGSRYFLWYQDSQSVQSALRVAKLLGVNGVSLWRLGTIPVYSFGDIRDWSWTCLFQE